MKISFNLLKILILSLILTNAQSELSQDDNSFQCPNSFVAVQQRSANGFTQDNATLRYQGKSYILPPNVYLMPSTNLMWQACPLGYTTNRNNHSCTVDFSSSQAGNWSEVHSEATAKNLLIDAGLADWYYNDWRVPNIKELTSLYIHPSCRAMDRKSLSTNTSSVVIGGTLIHSLPTVENNNNHWYWSSSPVLQDEDINSDKAWAINFETGEVAIKEKSELFKVILVRDRTFEN
jgi:hypothetical protein